MRVRRTLLAQLLLSFGLVSVLSTLTIGLVQARTAEQKEYQKEDEWLSAGSVALAREVSLRLTTQVAAIDSLAAQLEQTGFGDVERAQPLIAATRTRFGFEVIYVAGPDGRSLVADPPTFEGRPRAGTDYSDRDYVREVIRTHTTVISDAQIGRTTGRPDLHVAAPILGPDGTLRGFIVGSLSARSIQKGVEELRTVLPNMRMLVVDRAGNVLAHYNPPPENALRNVATAPLLTDGEDGQRLTTLDDTGQRVRAVRAVVTTEGLRWRVVAFRPVTEIEAELAPDRRGALMAFALALAIALVLSVVQAARLSAPIKRLGDLAGAIARGERVDAPTRRGGEPLEVANLIDATAQMLKTIREHTENLESTVEDRTRLLTVANAELQKNLEQLRTAKAQLGIADRMASIGTLAAGVAHEINNPLAYVVSNLQYSLDELSSGRATAPKEMSAALQEALDGALRMGRIVGDLKLFSVRDDPSNVRLDVRKPLEVALTMARNEVKHRAVLERDLADVPLVLGSASRLSQVFLNLIVNAAQAIPEGATSNNFIRVRTGTDEKGHVVVSVEDTGSGISPEHLKRVFDPFFTTKPVGQGTGLGLSISHSIVASMGGTIEVASEPGTGTTFTVRLPAVRGVSPDAPASAAPRPGRRGRILVVDDEPFVGRAIERLLSPQHDLTVVSSGREALDQLGQSTFDLVLCDLIMPDLDGAEVYEQATARDPALARRFVFLTGGAFTDRAREFLRANAPRVVEKPFDLAALRALVTELLAPVEPKPPG